MTKNTAQIVCICHCKSPNNILVIHVTPLMAPPLKYISNRQISAWSANYSIADGRWLSKHELKLVSVFLWQAPLMYYHFQSNSDKHSCPVHSFSTVNYRVRLHVFSFFYRRHCLSIFKNVLMRRMFVRVCPQGKL